ncbi:MAG: hypothetical protein RB191_11510 [Terriglobia bacterium]|nr:hypothetical protein [Terriglobia bacterium]
MSATRILAVVVDTMKARLDLSVRAAKLGVKIRTDHVFPPIPVRHMDWAAIDDNTYDGAEDASDPVGRGATELEAIEDLLTQIEERKA